MVAITGAEHERLKRRIQDKDSWCGGVKSPLRLNHVVFTVILSLQ